MTTNETIANKTIAEWLGAVITHTKVYFVSGVYKNLTRTFDFIHDRNQQKWIRDKLKELGYVIETETCNDDTKVTIYIPDDGWEIPNPIYDKDEDQAFIEAVLELIEKEEIK